MNKLAFAMIFLVFLPDAIAQTDIQNHLKYWFYRDRFKKYFVSIGDEPGQSIPIFIRNRGFHNVGSYDEDDIIQFGETGIDLGYNMGVLSTEFALLNSKGLDVSETLIELYYTLQAINRLDYVAESVKLNMANEINGYFIREDVPDDFVINHGELNNQLPPFTGQYPIGDGLPLKDREHDLINKMNSEMSQDQAYGIMVGCALVREFIPESITVFDLQGSLVTFPMGEVSLSKEAANIANRIMKNASDNGYLFKAPNGVIVGNNDGESNNGTAIPFAYGIAKAMEYILQDQDRSSSYFNLTALAEQPLWDLLQDATNIINICHNNNWEIFNCDALFNLRMVLEIAAVGNSWKIAGFNTTFDDITDLASANDWDSFYGLLWHSLHGDEVSRDISLIQSKALDQLNSAPCSGPYAYYPSNMASGGWASATRFRNDLNEQNNGPVEGKAELGSFSGLDYMLLHNMYYLSKSPAIPDYSNFLNYVEQYDYPRMINVAPGISINVGTAIYPHHARAHNSIYSDKIVANNGVVHYEAPEIYLDFGFDANSAHEFTADLKSPVCDPFQNFYRNMIFEIEQSSMGTPVTILTPEHYSLESHNFEYMVETESLSQDRNLMINIGPNPFKDNLQLLSKTSCEIELYHISGKVVYSGVFMDNLTINTIDLPSGVYILQFKNRESTEHIKLVKYDYK